MARSYDAWAEFEPTTAQAIRYAVKSGDWSGIALADPAAADALQRAIRDDDWSAFEPTAARALRAAVAQDRTRLDADEDRALAADMRQLAAKYPDFNANMKEILQSALDNELPDLDLAYKAWRGSSGPYVAADAVAKGGSSESDSLPNATRIGELRADIARRVGEGKGSEPSTSQLRYELSDLEDDQVMKMAQANDPDDRRRELIHDENEATRYHNSQRADRLRTGHTAGEAKSKEATRARMERDALDLVQGRAKVSPARPQPREERDAERHGLDDRDRKVAAAFRSGNPNSLVPTAAQSSLESIAQQIVNE